jgi:hypothetical protein
MKIQYASNLLIHRVGGGSPLAPRAPVLVLAGGTGPLSSIRVQMFYHWCSRNFDQTYTLLDSRDDEQKILPNVHALSNRRTHLLPNGMVITADKYNYDADILVTDAGDRYNPIQIHSMFAYHVVDDNRIVHVANSMNVPQFKPTAALELN